MIRMAKCVQFKHQSWISLSLLISPVGTCISMTHLHSQRNKNKIKQRNENIAKFTNRCPIRSSTCHQIMCKSKKITVTQMLSSQNKCRSTTGWPLSSSLCETPRQHPCCVTHVATSNVYYFQYHWWFRQLYWHCEVTANYCKVSAKMCMIIKRVAKSLWPSRRTTCVSWYPQLRTGWFCLSKVLLSAMPLLIATWTFIHTYVRVFFV